MRVVIRRLFSQQVRHSSSKPYYITAPIFYVNASPHLGHLYSMLLCDVKSRWAKLSGHEAFFTVGTDEHGLKVQAAAADAKKTPQDFCDFTTRKFKMMANVMDIKYDRFIRTTDPDHAEAVTHFWNVLLEKGYIYKGLHTGWYSVSDETFYPIQQLEWKVIDGVKSGFSKETGSPVTFETEKNYFFNMKALRNDLIKHLQENPDFITPKKYHEDILKELTLNEGHDLSISRPLSRLRWGLRVPNDSSQVIYVWVDALVNYLTSTGYPWSESSELTPVSNPWPAVHLIGKDIIRFHCIYWPSLLLAAGVELPKQIVVHGHWLMAGSKMSKSKGNVADPVVLSEYYGSDSLRFFLCENSILTGDCDFTELKLSLTRNQIVDKIGNLLIRVLAPKFKVERALAKYESIFQKEEFINSLGNSKSVTEIKTLISDVNSLYEDMDKEMETFTTHRAIGKVWNVIQQANQVFQNGEPWKFKADKQLEGSLNDPLHKQDFLVFLVVETLRVSMIVLQPFIPNLSDEMLNTLKVDFSKRKVKYAEIGSDLLYGDGVSRAKGTKVPIRKLDVRKGAYA